MLKVRLKEVLNKHGYTLYDLSDAILELEGLSESTVYRFARGEQNVTLKKLELILAAVRSLTGQPIRLHDLIGDEAPSLTDEPSLTTGKAEPDPTSESGTKDLVFFAQGKTAEEVEDVWELIALAQGSRRRTSKRRTPPWLLGLGGVSLVGLALLLVFLAASRPQVAALLSRLIPFTPSEFAVRVVEGNDDAEEVIASREIYRDSNDLELVEDRTQNGHQQVGVRFQNVKLSPGATVEAAYIEFKADSSDSAPTSLTIWGEASDSADTFRTSEGNISERPLTSATVVWDEVAPWEAGQTYRTPDLSAIVQEIIDRNGWASGNSVAFVINGSGVRTAESFESRPADAPLLRVEYVR